MAVEKIAYLRKISYNINIMISNEFSSGPVVEQPQNPNEEVNNFSRRALLLAGIAAAAGACARQPDNAGWQGIRQPAVAPQLPVANWSSRAAMANAPFADKLQAEQLSFDSQYVPDPVIGFRLPDFSGTYINTQAGQRRTYGQDLGSDGNPVSLWLMGGSSAYGYGQRDNYTIASRLSKLAEDDRINLQAKNIAMCGWVIPQEVAAITERLKTQPAPDMTVFYDGWNDTFASVQVAISRQSLPVGEFRIDEKDATEIDRRLNSGEAEAAIKKAGGVEALALFTAERYRKYKKIADAALGAAKVEPFYIFQPDVTANKRQLDFIRGTNPNKSARDIPSLPLVLARTAELLEADGVANQRQVFANTLEPVFLDGVHTNELGADLAAKAIYKVIRPSLFNRAK